MKQQSGIHTLISDGGPVLFLVILCTGVGALFLALNSVTGLVFLVAGGGSLAAFFITDRATHPAGADPTLAPLSTMDRRRRAR